MKLEGADRLIDDFSAMAARLNEDGPACNGILEAGAVPIHQQMKANASSDPKYHHRRDIPIHQSRAR
jgi:hypothetical protein